MSNDITFCVSKICKRKCRRKQFPKLGEKVSYSDFGVDYKGDYIDFNFCKYYIEERGNNHDD